MDLVWDVVVGGDSRGRQTKSTPEPAPEGLRRLRDGVKKVWEVIGGTCTGGINVWKGQQSCNTPMLPERIGQGALLQECQVTDDRLCYQKLSGSGPETGWVNIKCRGRYQVRCWLLRQSYQRYGPKPRFDSALSLQPQPLRLRQTPPAAESGPTTHRPLWYVVEKLRSQGRLLVLPDGPPPMDDRVVDTEVRAPAATLKVAAEPAVVKPAAAKPDAAVSAPPAALAVEPHDLQPPVPRGKFVAAGTGRPKVQPWVPRLPELSHKLRQAFPWETIFKGKGPNEFWEMAGPALSQLPSGFHYGIQFPWSLQQLQSKGAAWLTKALHAAGTLPKANAVMAMEAREFVGGGAALKAMLTVKYKTPDPELHEKLFVKYPFPYTGERASDVWSWVCVTNNDGPEIDFARMLSAAVPMRCPKYYFGDICPRSGVYILITECLDFPPDGADSGPFELEPIPRKSVDYLLDDPFAYYVAITRNAARLAAWGANGKLGRDVLRTFAPPEISTMLAMGVKSKIPKFLRFSREVAPRLFEPGMVDDAFEGSLYETLIDLERCQRDVFRYLLGNKALIGLTHQNMNIDNAFFWRDEQGGLESGFIDWGRFRQENYATALLNGLLCCDLVDLLTQRDRELLEVFCQEYAKEHRPMLVTAEELWEHYLLSWCVSSLFLVNVADVSIYPSWEHTRPEAWSSIPDYRDPRVFNMPNCNSGFVAMIRQFAWAWKYKDIPSFWASWRRRHLGEPAAPKGKAKAKPGAAKVLRSTAKPAQEPAAPPPRPAAAPPEPPAPSQEPPVPLVAAAAAEPEPPAAPPPPERPRALRPASEVAPAFEPVAHLGPFKRVMQLKKLRERASQRLLGEFYGLYFPATPEELASEYFGVDWLTDAFQRAGSIPEDNAVSEIVSLRRFDGGGSGPKALFVVKYQHPDSTLDRKLFMKVPHPLWENEQQRYMGEGKGMFGDGFGGEINYYRFLSPHTPFPVPKLYFGDLNRESTEACLINAAVEWPEKGKTDFGPFEVLPPCGKCEDYELKDPHEFYFAILQRTGTFAGLAKCGRLGPDLPHISWYDATATTDIFCAVAMPGQEKIARSFIVDTAPHFFPEQVKKLSFLDKFERQMAEVQALSQSIGEFLYADPRYIGLSHQNGNTDNAYFYKQEEGRLECGILDWGSTAHMSYATSFQGTFVSALGEMLVEYDDRLVRAWLDAYHATGAPQLDFEELLFRYRLATCVSAYGTCSLTRNLIGAKELFASATFYHDEPIRRDFNLRFNMGMIYNRMVLFALRGDTYWGAVKDFQKRKAAEKR